MKAMFWGAESFNQNLSAWGDKLGKVQNMKKMFQSTALNIDFISSWKIPEDCDISELWLSPFVSFVVAAISAVPVIEKWLG